MSMVNTVTSLQQAKVHIVYIQHVLKGFKRIVCLAFGYFDIMPTCGRLDKPACSSLQGVMRVASAVRGIGGSCVIILALRTVPGSTLDGRV